MGPKTNELVEVLDKLIDLLDADGQEVTAQNLVGNFTQTPLKPSKINKDFPGNAFLPPNFEQLQIEETDSQGLV